MRAATIRRSLVLVVCAVGVGALYLAPGMTGTPGEVAAGRPADEPLRPTASRSSPAPTTPGSASGGSDSRSDPTSDLTGGPGRAGGAGQDAPDGGEDRTDPSGDARPTTPDSSSARPASTRVATAYGSSDADREPPQPVRKITTETVTALRLGLSWPASRDNVRVVGYHIWLNGFEVASTAQTHATVRWFNDDTSTHVVQVKAVDEAGNESLTSPTVLVTRPDPDPEPSTPAPSTPAPAPDPTPDPSASATTEPGGAPATDPTSEPTAPVKAPKRTT